MSALNIRPRTPDDDTRAVEIGNALEPEFPPETVEEYRYWSDPKRRPKGTRIERFVAEVDGSLAGLGMLLEMWWAAQPYRFMLRIVVDRAYRGRSVGSGLYDCLSRTAEAMEAHRLYSQVREDEPEAQTFASKRGFEQTGHSLRMSRLNVHEANLSGYDGLVERLASEGIKILTVAEVGADNEAFLRRLQAVSIEAAQDEPGSEAYGGSPFELFKEELLDSPFSSAEQLWVAMVGDEPVGCAFLEKKGTDGAFNNGTDVLPAYRHRGIARAMKLRQIEWARRNGINFLYTGNDIKNQAMLSINIPLGYEPLPSKLEVVKVLRQEE